MHEEVAQGQLLAGKYRVERVLGRGGMGVVVAAHHIVLDEIVAIKFLLPEALHSAERIERLARAAGFSASALEQACRLEQAWQPRHEALCRGCGSCGRSERHYTSRHAHAQESPVKFGIKRQAVRPLLALSGVAAGLCAPHAHAESDAASRALAVQLFDQAEALLAQQRTAEACPKYAESFRLDPQLGALIYLAE